VDLVFVGAEAYFYLCFSVARALQSLRYGKFSAKNAENKQDILRMHPRKVKVF